MNRTLFLVPASIVVIAGVVAALWVLGSASGGRTMFSSLEVAPGQADVFFAINTDPTSPQWLAVNRSLDNINAKDPIRKAIDEALADVNLEWDRDIAPVAGDEAFYSIPDITEFGPDGGWDAGILLSDAGHAREVFDELRARDDSPPMTEEDYNGVTIYTTEVSTPLDIGSSGSASDCIRIVASSDSPTTTTEPCADEGDSFYEYEPVFDCGGFGFRADGTLDEEAYGGEPCENEEQYCLWNGFVPTGDDAAPYDTAPCEGTSSYCGGYGLLPIATPAPDGLPCGDDFGYLFGEPYFDDGPIFDPVELTPSTSAIAFVNSVLALGATADDVKAVIDVVQGRAESANSNERLLEFREHQKEDFLVWGYADLADVWKEAGDTLSGTGYSTGVDTQDLFDQMRATYDRVGFSLSSMNEGFAFDLTVVHSPDFDENNAFEPTNVYDPAIAEILPADTMFYLSAFDIYNQSWLPGKAQWEGLDFGEEGSLKDILDRVRDDTGVDLESDVLALLTGELAIAANVNDLEDFDVSVFGIADVNSEEQAEGTMRRFGDYLEDEDIIAAGAEGDIQIWNAVEDVPTIGWYVDNGRVVIGHPDAAAIDLHSAASAAPSLADTDDWKRTIELLPEDKTLFGYLSIARILEEIRQTDGAAEGFEDSSDGEVTLDDLGPIRSVGIAGTSRDDGFGVHVVLFMKDS